jgi:hypothetical protein
MTTRASDSPEHECRQHRRCKARVKNANGKYRGLGVERPDSLCLPCEEHAFAAIRQLKDDYGLLWGARTEEPSTSSQPKVSGSTELPVPIALGVDALITEFDEEAARWSRRLSGEDPYSTNACLSKIFANLGTIADMPPSQFTVWVPHPDGGDSFAATVMDGVDGILRLANLHRRAQALLGLVEMTTFLPDPCPHCARKALAVSKDQELITCKGCRVAWDSAHFALLSNVLDFERKAVKV